MEKIDIKEIQGVDKYKTLTLSNGIRITLKDGQKFNFSFTSSEARDDAFTKLLERVTALENQIKSEPSKEEQAFLRDLKEKEKEREKELSQSPPPTPEKEVVKFSRFDD